MSVLLYSRIGVHRNKHHWRTSRDHFNALQTDNSLPAFFHRFEPVRHKTFDIAAGPSKILELTERLASPEIQCLVKRLLRSERVIVAPSTSGISTNR